MTLNGPTRSAAPSEDADTPRPPSPLQPGVPPRPILDAFYVPRGLLGRIGGGLMARGLPQQGEVADLVGTPGADLCELGCGPGVLADVVAEQYPRVRLHLVDPSEVMRVQAARRCRRWQLDGRVDISPGTADHMPLADEACDTLVSVNTVVMWPDLGAGLREIRRVLRPGGRLVLSWHSASAPSSNSRRLALHDSGIQVLTEALRATFSDVQTRDLTHSVAWEARRPA